MSTRDERRWHAWRPTAEGRKPPCDDHGHPLPRWNEPDTWLTLGEARARAARCGGGIGAVAGNGLTFVDLDKCRDPETGVVDPRALAVIASFSGAYWEVSPSARGLHVICRAAAPPLELNFADAAEVRRSKPAGFVTVTGDQSHGSMDADGAPGMSFWAADDKARGNGKKEPLAEIVREGGRNQVLFHEAAALRGRGYGALEILAVLEALNARCDPPTPDHELRAIAHSAARYDAGTAADARFEPDQLRAALHFADTRGSLWRYDHRQDRWLHWDGVRWAPDRQELILREIADMVLERIAAIIAEGKKIGKLASLTGRNALIGVRDIARTREPLASAGDEWDRDPWLLGVPNGVVDLRTGELRAGHADDRITMQTACAYDAEAPAPLWESTIADIFKDQGPEFVAYAQRALGYSVTGVCSEEAFFLLTGIGRNGKGTIVNTIAEHVLGDYTENLAFRSLEEQQHDSSTSPDMAKLDKKRFVTASEGTGGRLNEARIKLLTGRDPLTACFKYKNEFTFVPQLKLWLSTQSEKKPRVRDGSEGFWARVHELQFTQCYKGREDKTLKNRLPAEAPGILAWLVRGAREWQRQGLNPPLSVLHAVDEYRESQEPLADFYDARCVFGPGCWTATEDLRANYAQWCDKERIRYRLGSKSFSRELTKRFQRTRRAEPGPWGYQGIGLTQVVESKQPGEDRDDLPF